MTQVTISEHADAPHADVHLTLSWSEVQELRTTLPWLLRALTERPTTPARQRERRRNASAALDRLLTALSSQVQQAEEDRLSQ